jgi:hypothetical protein
MRIAVVRLRHSSVQYCRHRPYPGISSGVRYRITILGFMGIHFCRVSTQQNKIPVLFVAQCALDLYIGAGNCRSFGQRCFTVPEGTHLYSKSRLRRNTSRCLSVALQVFLRGWPNGGLPRCTLRELGLRMQAESQCNQNYQLSCTHAPTIVEQGVPVQPPQTPTYAGAMSFK